MPRLLLLFSILLSLISGGVWAQTLTVSTVTRPPFSFEEDGADTGFSMDILQALAEELGWNVEIVRHDAFGDMLTAVESGQSDLAVANISITAAREAVMDFSHPIFESGLQIMVPAQATRSPNLFRAFLSRDLLIAIGIAFLLLFFGGMVMWVFERRAQPYFDRPAREAIFPSFWWALNLVVNGGFEERIPRTIFGRMFAVLLVISSLFVVSVFVAKITSVMTVAAISGTINSVSDLYGQQVGTIEGSTAAGFLDRREIDFQRFTGRDPMLRAFEEGQLDAVVFDAPILNYYTSHQGREFGSMVGSVFLRENYGMVFPADSLLVEDTNRELLKFRESDTYDEIYRRWFGGVN